MQLIVGLGNPGEKYRDNPHNIGFRTLDQLMDALNLEGFQRRFNSEFFRTNENGKVTLMLKPETFMNSSGEAIAECARYFKIPPEKILVISDDLELPAGKARLRDSGGHGGHNGLRSIIECLGTDKFLRARIGIGRPSTFDKGKQASVTKYVLGKMEETKAELCLQAMEKVVEMLVRFVRYSHFQSTSISIPGPEISTTG
ncbi:MAG: aminoacyl-tRNA hydrolase [SAR324 cluster bacterium]|nr:aminoacyl-tRNA hydrolase [SAR324 cluster bacterium]